MAIVMKLSCDVKEKQKTASKSTPEISSSHLLKNFQKIPLLRNCINYDRLKLMYVAYIRGQGGGDINMIINNPHALVTLCFGKKLKVLFEFKSTKYANASGNIVLFAF